MIDKKIGTLISLKIKKIFRKEKISLHSPIFSSYDKTLIKHCIESTFVSSSGPWTEKFEKILKKFTKSKNVIAVCNGTSALHLSLKTLNVGINDEVIISNLNFIAAPNAIKYCGAEPVLIDCCSNSLGIDVKKYEDFLLNKTLKKKNYLINKKTKKKIKAIIVTHIFGHSGNIEKIVKISKRYNLKVVEDASEALGSFYKKKHLGTFGDLGILSFNGNKIITTGGGGAILTKNKKVAKYLKHISTTAKKKHRFKFDYDEIGYNYRMPNLNAALGCSQIKKISSHMKRKKYLYDCYLKEFKNNKYFSLFTHPKNSKGNLWLQTLILNKKYSKFRDRIINFLINDGIQARPIWTIISKQKKFKNSFKSDIKNSKILEKQIINIPSLY